MEEINKSLDALRRLFQAGVIEHGSKYFMNETISITNEMGGCMESITSPYPDNIDTCVRLFVKQPCSSDAAFRILCVREHIRHITVAGRTYSRQEIACMEAGKNLGSDNDNILRDVPMPRTPPVATDWQPATTEAQRNILQEPVRPPLDHFTQPREMQQAQDLIGGAVSQAIETARAQQANPTRDPFWYETVRTQSIIDPAYREAMDVLRRVRQNTNDQINPTPVETLMQTMGITREVAEELMTRYYNPNQPVPHPEPGMLWNGEIQDLRGQIVAQDTPQAGHWVNYAINPADTYF